MVTQRIQPALYNRCIGWNVWVEQDHRAIRPSCPRRKRRGCQGDSPPSRWWRAGVFNRQILVGCCGLDWARQRRGRRSPRIHDCVHSGGLTARMRVSDPPNDRDTYATSDSDGFDRRNFCVEFAWASTSSAQAAHKVRRPVLVVVETEVRRLPR